jgi:uncharacterized protein
VKVNINPIRDVRGGIVTFEGKQDLDAIKQIEELGLEFLTPLDVKGKITNTGEGFLVEAELSCQYQSSCNRCLECFTSTLEADFKEEYVCKDADTEDNCTVIKGDYLDLTEPLVEQVILSLPMKFICKEECRGFCSSCGANLNETECSCVDEPINPQFEKLKSLLNTKEVD